MKDRADAGTPAMPDILRLFIRNALIGFGIAAIFVAVLVWLDVNGLRGSLAGEDRLGLALFILWFGNGTFFAALQIAWAVMALRKR